MADKPIDVDAVRALCDELEALRAYVIVLEAECMAVTDCAYALSSAVNLAGNYDRNARILIDQQNKGENMFCDLFAARHGSDREPMGVRLLREKNEAADAAKRSE